MLHLVRRSAGVKPGQEAELDQVERDFDGGLVLNGLTASGPALRQRIAERRARLAPSIGHNRCVAVEGASWLYSGCIRRRLSASMA